MNSDRSLSAVEQNETRNKAKLLYVIGSHQVPVAVYAMYIIMGVILRGINNRVVAPLP